MLLWSHARVVDLGGLCDETIARTLFHDPPAARDSVLGARHPTFLHVADVWARAAAFEADPRFAADYTPIHAYDAAEDPRSEGHASGLFVRRDALPPGDAGAAALEALRREPADRLAFLPRPAPSKALAWLSRFPFIRAEYRRIASATSASVSIADPI
jgi:hypothetical protein